MKSVTEKTEAGSAAITRLLPLLIVIIISALITVEYAGYTKILNTKDEISLTMRKYIIRMETHGYLTDDDKTSMTRELEALGMSAIDFIGTTVSEVDYGETIYLNIKGKLTVRSYSIKGLFEGGWGTVTIDIDETSSSTSQQ